jgi:hypothetical protein
MHGALHLSLRRAAREDHRQIVMALTDSSPEKMTMLRTCVARNSLIT